MKRVARVLVLALGVTAVAGAETISLTDALAVGRTGRSGRSAVHTDAVEATIVAGTWTTPSDGDEIELPDGGVTRWAPVHADDKGWITGLGGYVSWVVESDRQRDMILHARAHSLVYVNGELRAGDPYSYGVVKLPVTLRRGANELVFRCARGRLKADLIDPPGEVYLDVADRTVPDLITGEASAVQAAVVVVNTTTQPIHGLTIAAGGSGLPVHETPLPVIPAQSVRKVPLWCGGFPPDTRRVELDLRLQRRRDATIEVIDDAILPLGVRRPDERHMRTFVSDIDGSVQYYAVTPPPPLDRSDEQPALVLTLHGAGVEARGQAAVYRPKDGCYVVAPTNRRKFGFDWEDWGRLDAVEVLDLVMRRHDVDPRRVYLTGHSMGGHGVWQVGATLPDRFAALGPSAGWVSFWSYAGATRYDDAEGIEAILMRAASPSDTVELSRNYLQHGVYILHGEKDDNVPADQARFMNEHLGGFHEDFTYHEEPGAGHWWGNRCCDWPPMFEFFRSRSRPETVDHVEFVTACPGVSSRSDWVTIAAQQRSRLPSRVVADLDRAARRYLVTTDNVAAMTLDVSELEPGTSVDVDIDGHGYLGLTWPEKSKQLHFEHADGWRVVPSATPDGFKSPQRCGPFKEALRRRMVFVYGTRGTPQERAWARNKARYDAETFWYRGNGAVDIVADVDFDPAAEPDRNVILYGHADLNEAWSALLPDSPVRVDARGVTIGDRTVDGEDLACLFVRPRPGSDVASVAVVCGTGVTGGRLTDRLPYFVSGVHYPDCIVIGPEMLTEGADGVRVAGFFGRDWSVETGDFAWR